MAPKVSARYVGRTIWSCYKYTKKCIYNIVIELWKRIKKSMATGIAQKRLYFHCGALGKMINQKWKKKVERGIIAALTGSLIYK